MPVSPEATGGRGPGSSMVIRQACNRFLLDYANSCSRPVWRSSARAWRSQKIKVRKISFWCL